MGDRLMLDQQSSSQVASSHVPPAHRITSPLSHPHHSPTAFFEWNLRGEFKTDQFVEMTLAGGVSDCSPALNKPIAKTNCTWMTGMEEQR